MIFGPSAFLYDSFTNSLLPFYEPSNLIELVRKVSNWRIRVTHFLLMLCAFAEGFLLWVLLALIRESRQRSSHRAKPDGTRRGPVSRSGELIPMNLGTTHDLSAQNTMGRRTA